MAPASVIAPLLGEWESTFPIKDAWGQELLYWCSSDGQHYVLASYGGTGGVDFAIGPLGGVERDRSKSYRSNVVITETGVIRAYSGWAFTDAISCGCYDPNDLDQEQKMNDEALRAMIDRFQRATEECGFFDLR